MEDSFEYKALRKSASLLKNGVSPDAIVSLLYEHELLTPDERSRANASHLTEEKRMEQVHLALERRVKVKSETFHTLIFILRGVPALAPVAEELHTIWINEQPKRPPCPAAGHPSASPTPAEAVGQNPELVLQPSQLPRHMMVPNNSMFTYPQREGPAIPQKRLAAPKNSVASFQNPSGDLPQYYGTHVRGLTPVQDSQHDTSRSRIHLSRPPMPLSPTFLKYGQSMHEDALNGGVTPGSSRKLHDLVRDYRDQSEQLRIAKESIARSDKYSCDFIES